MRETVTMPVAMDVTKDVSNVRKIIWVLLRCSRSIDRLQVTGYRLQVTGYREKADSHAATIASPSLLTTEKARENSSFRGRKSLHGDGFGEIERLVVVVTPRVA